ncbi:MAG: acyloxyacyl hydrolase [Nitrospinota bacterium]|nr:acyloxyacyl hydrolase [Nitrospinota bacterium]
MNRYIGALLWVLLLIPLSSERVWAQFFNPRLAGDSSEVVLSSTREGQVAQASPDSGVAAAQHGNSLPDFESRFAKGQYVFGMNLGFGFSINIPPVDAVSDERTKIRFAHVFPHFKYNLTGIMGKSIYRGALYWVIEAGIAVTVKDPSRNNQVVENAPNYQFGLVPMQFEYKFLNPERSWAPFLFAGVGGSWGDWFQESKELATSFEFILQAGAGMEYHLDNGTSFNINYRLWHLSNSNVKSPNIGINAHIFSLGFSF